MAIGVNAVERRRHPVWLRLRPLGYSSTTWRLTAEEQLRNVEHLHVFPSRRARHAIGHHVQTKRTGRGERARAGRDSFLRTQDGNALRRCLLKPHPTSARAAAESLFPAARHFAKL